MIEIAGFHFADSDVEAAAEQVLIAVSNAKDISGLRKGVLLSHQDAYEGVKDAMARCLSEEARARAKADLVRILSTDDPPPAAA